VSQMTVNNGMTNALQTNDVTTYNYKNGFYKFDNREFRGFGEVDTTEPNSAKTTNFFQQSDALKGLLSEKDLNDSVSLPYTKLEDSWGVASTSGIYTVNLNTQKNSTFDGSASNLKVAEKDYQYDSYGNVTKESDLGDTSVSGDER